MSAFRPSLNEDDRQTLIDVMDFAVERANSAAADNQQPTPDQRFAARLARNRIIRLRSKLFPDLYPPNRAVK